MEHETVTDRTHQVALVQCNLYPNTTIPHTFDFTLVGGSAFWIYTPMVGLIQGEDGSLYTVDMWLEEWVDYPVQGHDRARWHMARLQAFHADLSAQR
jgi:hypothetical protein